VRIQRSARIREWFEIIECVQLVHCHRRESRRG
jgi:hypothetical protein